LKAGDLFVTDFGGPLQLLTATPQDARGSVVPLGLRESVRS
jgi:hypothetical protein